MTFEEQFPTLKELDAIQYDINPFTGQEVPFLVFTDEVQKACIDIGILKRTLEKVENKLEKFFLKNYRYDPALIPRHFKKELIKELGL